MKENKKVTEYINSSSTEQVEILNTLRQLIHATISGTKEDIKWGIPVFTKTKIFTYLRSTKNHISLGLYNIDRINDPNGLLEGTGKSMRYLKIAKVEDINEKLIKEWLKATVE